jgi:hypothetical protein
MVEVSRHLLIYSGKGHSSGLSFSRILLMGLAAALWCCVWLALPAGDAGLEAARFWYTSAYVQDAQAADPTQPPSPSKTAARQSRKHEREAGPPRTPSLAVCLITSTAEEVP